MIPVEVRDSSPRGNPHGNRNVRLHLCATALALVITFASFASAQVLEGQITLPDTLGPLNGPYCLACTDDPDFPRLYIGGAGGFYPGRPPEDSGGVIVAEANKKCHRLARIATGPVKALCYVASHRKLYVASLGVAAVKVVDCATNQVVSTVQVAGEAPVLQYNRQNDRLYCGGNSILIIDCAADTVVRAIGVAARVIALDSADNKLCAGGDGQLTVIDCATDSVSAAFPRIDSVGALCFNPTAGKVYAISGDTLYAVRTRDNSIVAALYFGGLVQMLACNPASNRIYFVDGISSRYLRIVDCASDSAVLRLYFNLKPYSLACNVARNLVYFGSYGEIGLLDGTSGQVQKWIITQSSTGCGWCPGLNRLYCPPVWRETEPYAKLCLLSTVDGSGDTVSGFLPLTMHASGITLDTVNNRLYFAYPSKLLGCIGAVDCSRNIVTQYTLVPGAEAVCYNPTNDRLYYGVYDLNAETSAVVAYDCASREIVKKIPVNGLVYAFRLHVALNKLYAETYGGLYTIDCKYDTIRSYIPWPDMYPGTQFLVPEDNTYWYLGPVYTMVVDCSGDTVTTLVPNHLATVSDARACPEDRRVYAGSVGKAAWTIDMDDPAHVDTLHDFQFPGNDGLRFVSIPGAHKAYMCVNHNGPPPGRLYFFVIDTRTSTLTDSFSVGRQVSGMSLDHTGRYIYGTVYIDSGLLVIDAQTDSVLPMFGLPASTYGPPLLNRATNRIYPFQSGNPIPVVRDSVRVGLEEFVQTCHARNVGPTVVSRGVPMRVSAAGELWDSSGCRAAVLHSGPNNIGRLAPGVYFVREASGVKREASSVRKVVLTE